MDRDVTVQICSKPDIHAAERHGAMNEPGALKVVSARAAACIVIHQLDNVHEHCLFFADSMMALRHTLNFLYEAPQRQ